MVFIYVYLIWKQKSPTKTGKTQLSSDWWQLQTTYHPSFLDEKEQFNVTKTY